MSKLASDMTDLSDKVYRDRALTHQMWNDRIHWAWERLEMNSCVAAWAKNYRRMNSDETVTFGEQTYHSPNELGDSVAELKGMIFPTTPLPSLRPNAPQDDDLTETQEWLCHDQLSRPEHGEELESVLEDALCCDFGVIKTVFEPDIEAERVGGGELDETLLGRQMLQIQQEQAAAWSGSIPPVLPTDVDWLHIDAHEQQLGLMDIKSNAYWALSAHMDRHWSRYRPSSGGRVRLYRVVRMDFLYDPEATRWQDWEWVAERTFEHVDDLKADPLLRHVDGCQTSTRRSTPLQDHDGNFDPASTRITGEQGGGGKPSYVEVWRIHDRRNHRLIVISPGHRDGVPLYVGDWPYRRRVGSRRFLNYLPLRLRPTNDRDTNTTIMEKAADLQTELDECWGKVRQLIKDYMPKTMIEDGGFEGEDESDFYDETKAIMHVLPGTSGKVKMVNNVPELAPLFNRIQDLERRIRRKVGIWEVSVGVPQANTATEAQIMANQQTTRIAQPRKYVNFWLSYVCLNILYLTKQFVSTEIMVRVFGYRQGLQWRRLRPEEIGEDLNCTIDQSSWNLMNPDLERRQWVELMSIIGNNPRINQEFILTETFKRFGVRNPERGILPPPPPMPPGAAPLSAQPGTASAPKLPGGPPGLGQMVGNAAASAGPVAR